MAARTHRSAGSAPEQLRLLAKVARMYHEQGLRQPQIAEQLHVSQPRVSRLLKRAAETGIVRTVVTMPSGTFTDLEQAIAQRYRLRDVVVVDTAGAGDDVLPALGASAAEYLDATLTGSHTIGVSSWSESLIATVELMRPQTQPVAELVVQLVGGLGDPEAQVQATRLAARLATITGATPLFLSAPGLVGAAATRRALLRDRAVREVTAQWSQLDVALVGIGSLEPSPLLQRSGNALGPDDQRRLRSLGAVGDVCLRYFDVGGKPVSSELDDRLVGITRRELLRVPRRIGVAGGARKFGAVRAALTGTWVNTLITDLDLANRLISEDT